MLEAGGGGGQGEERGGRWGVWNREGGGLVGGEEGSGWWTHERPRFLRS